MKRFIMEMGGKDIIVVNSTTGFELAMQHGEIYVRPVHNLETKKANGIGKSPIDGSSGEEGYREIGV